MTERNDGFWVTEANSGFGATIRATKELYSVQSPYQKIEIFETATMGRMLMLDGIIQLTEFDEYTYQEMMAHLPLFAHPDPRRVLVIGGGDGGVLREIAKHEMVEEIDICEIDEMVIAAARKYLPGMAVGFEDPRVHINIADGTKFIAGKEGYYDVIIVDSTDPVGPGEALFNEQFYTAMKRALRTGGVIASQSESIFLFLDIVLRLNGIVKKLFKYTGYSSFEVPTYPTGLIGCCIASDSRDVTKVARAVPEAMKKQLRFYSSEYHAASFVMPKFAAEALAEVTGR